MHVVNIENGAYNITQENGSTFVGNLANLTFEIDGNKIGITDISFRKWMPLIEDDANNIRVNGDVKTAAQIKIFAEEVIKSLSTKIVPCTQEEYDAIEVKETDTLYLIVEK